MRIKSIRLAVLCLMALCLSQAFSAEQVVMGGTIESRGGFKMSFQPLLAGGFWQMGDWVLQNWTDKGLENEVKSMKEVGMSYIIVQYGADWDGTKKEFISLYSNSVYKVLPSFTQKGRDPIGAMMKAGEKYGVKIILGDALVPNQWDGPPNRNLADWSSPKMMQWRQSVIKKYSKYSSFYGWYIPNEPNPQDFIKNKIDPQSFIHATEEVAITVKKANPKLIVIHTVGLYVEPVVKSGKTFIGPPSIPYLDKFWEPWVKDCHHVDIWMIIDGVGTYLSNLEHTDKAQQWCRKLANKYQKTYWTDVENAVMGAQSYPFTMDQLEKSLIVGAKHTDTLVTFDYIHYMSKTSPKPEARKLYQDYWKYYHSMTKQK